MYKPYPPYFHNRRNQLGRLNRLYIFVIFFCPYIFKLAKSSDDRVYLRWKSSMLKLYDLIFQPTSLLYFSFLLFFLYRFFTFAFFACFLFTFGFFSLFLLSILLLFFGLFSLLFLTFSYFNIFLLNCLHSFIVVAEHFLELLLTHFREFYIIFFHRLISLSDGKPERLRFILDDLFFLLNCTNLQVLLISLVPLFSILFFWDQCSYFGVVVRRILFNVFYDLQGSVISKLGQIVPLQNGLVLRHLL